MGSSSPFAAAPSSTWSRGPRPPGRRSPSARGPSTRRGGGRRSPARGSCGLLDRSICRRCALEAGALAEADCEDLDGADGLWHGCSPDAAGRGERGSAREPRKHARMCALRGACFPRARDAGCPGCSGKGCCSLHRCRPPTSQPSWFGCSPLTISGRPGSGAARGRRDRRVRLGGEAGSGEEAVNSRPRVRARHRDHGRPDAGHGRHRGGAARGPECPGVTVLLVSAEPLASPASDLLRSRAAAFSRSRTSGLRSCACSGRVRTPARRPAPSPEPRRPAWEGCLLKRQAGAVVRALGAARLDARVRHAL